jgi:shikimate kinase
MLEVPVFLTGFMGVGKSKIGSILAWRLQRDFLDTDRMVERRAGKTISTIFADEGEAHFRQLEHECVLEACQHKNAVIALGGGAIAQERNLQVLRREGVLVCLQADVDTILERVSRRDDRPLLARLSPRDKRAKIESMLAERAPYYERAHIKMLSREGQTPEETAAKLIELLEYWSEESRRAH